MDSNLEMKIAELQECILNAHPKLPIILKEIHTNLKNDPANVTLLSEEQIAIIVSGLKQQTKTEITQATLKKSTKALSRVSADDL